MQTEIIYNLRNREITSLSKIEMPIIKKYYDNGSIFYEIYTDKYGIYHGEFKKYYPNGKLWEQRNYVNGILEGKVITFHLSGKIKMVVNYKDGKIYTK